MTEENEQKEPYGLFNGRRKADEYVKGYLKGITIISAVGVTVILGFGGWVSKEIYDHEIRLTKIESDRFTSKDALGLSDKIYVELQKIKQELSDLPNKLPPQWVRDLLAQNSRDIRELQDKTRR